MKCIHCGKELRTFNIVDENDNPLCDNCFVKYYEYCGNCRRAIPRGNGLCQSCSDVVFKKIMNGYSTKVTNIYGNKSDSIKCLNDRYFGLEMEYNYFSPSVSRVLFKELYDKRLIYNKSDNSISDGVEIVTIPLVKSRLLKLIDDMDITRIKPRRKSESVTCGAGLHIHVSRNTISPMAVHRLSILLNSGWASPYKKYIYYLSGRADRLVNASVLTDGYFRVGTTSLLKSIQNEAVSSHGVALNLGNSHTIEFRIFKATINPEQLKSYVEFTELAIKFAETQPIKMMTIPNFVTYLYLNATNGWLKDRLEYIKKSEPNLFNVKERQFTYNYYLSKFKDMNDTDIYNAISTMNREVYSGIINWDVETIDTNIISIWRSKSCGYHIESSKLLDGLLQEIKMRTVRKILAK